MNGEADLASRVQAWISGDPDPETRAELEALSSASDIAALHARFDEPLGFGTAGLRGVVRAGPAAMNRAVVIRATHALAEHLKATVPDARTLPVVIGYDARPSSHSFAEAAAGVLDAANVPVRYFEEAVPTPLVAYAVRQLAASAGIVITASHNPPEYNGYKLYASNRVQVVAPADRDVERRIATGPAAASVALTPGAMDGASPRSRPIPQSLYDRYLAEVTALVPSDGHARDLRIVYTPLHGVGGALATRALAAAGFSDVRVVPEQAEPDGTFPTVRFPNPEEPGALDLAVRFAKAERADLILANDPDADRLGVGVPTPSGGFVLLTGNQIGVLLADFMLEGAPKVPMPLVVSTVVSSPMAEAVARARGARFEHTLTGFKWIQTAALDLEAREHVRFAFGFEEALGYSVGRFVRDKDGIGAAVVFAALAARCRAQGISVRERLAALYRRYGLWASAQHSVACNGSDGLQEIRRAVDRAAASPPAMLGGRTVTSVSDFRRDGAARPRFLGESPLIVLSLEDGGRAVLRPSGTEPKLKIYVDLHHEITLDDDVWNAETALAASALDIATELAASIGIATNAYSETQLS